MNTAKKIRFKSGELKLEGCLFLPEGNGPHPVVIVNHPHPQYGGSMNNNVVDSLCEVLVNKSIAALKFNIRGVGESEGVFRPDSGPEQDVVAAIDYAGGLAGLEVKKVGLAGYSAGAAWGAAAACKDERVKAVALISPALALFDFGMLRDFAKPKLLISGNNDQLLEYQELIEFSKTLSQPVECHMVDEADHSWWNHEKQMAEIVSDFFKRKLE